MDSQAETERRFDNEWMLSVWDIVFTITIGDYKIGLWKANEEKSQEFASEVASDG